MSTDPEETIHATVMIRHLESPAARVTTTLGITPSWTYPADSGLDARSVWGLESFTEVKEDTVEAHLAWVVGLLTRLQSELASLRADAWDITVTLTVPQGSLEGVLDRLVEIRPDTLVALAQMGATLALFVP